MSFEILEYPIKSWILSLIDDEKIKSEMFDLLGEPEVNLKYPSIILYDIENLIEHDKYNLVVKLELKTGIIFITPTNLAKAKNQSQIIFLLL